MADARDTAERHAQDVVDAKFGRLMQDFAGSAMNEVHGTRRSAAADHEIRDPL